MTLASPCVWGEIFITQMKDKNGSWMANGVEWTDCFLFMLPYPSSAVSLGGWSLSIALSGLHCSWVFCSGQPVIGICRRLEKGQRHYRGQGAFPSLLCSEAILLAESLPDYTCGQAAPSSDPTVQFPLLVSSSFGVVMVFCCGASPPLPTFLQAVLSSSHLKQAVSPAVIWQV